MAKVALGAFGGVDIVVNNAAIRPHKPFLEMDEEFWHNVISVDMHSAFYTGQAFLPGMVERVGPDRKHHRHECDAWL